MPIQESWEIAGKVRMTPRGIWSASTSYNVLDIVSDGMASYIAKKTVPAGTALSNTEYWAVMVNASTLSNSMANAFNPAIKYQQGTLVMYDNQLYILNMDHEVNVSWEDTSKSSITLATSITRALKSLADEWSDTGSYQAGDFVIYQNRLYRFESDNNAGHDSNFVYLTSVLKEIEGGIANHFSKANNYSVGDLVIYKDKLWRFTSAHAAGAWNQSHVEGFSTATGIYRSLVSLAPYWDSSASYPVGDYVIYNSRLYKIVPQIGSGVDSDKQAVYLATIVRDIERDVSKTMSAISNKADVVVSSTNGKLINEVTKSINNTSSNSWKVTNAIQVSAGERYVINAYMKWNGFIAAMDSNQDIKSVVPHTAGAALEDNLYKLTDYVYEVPSGVYYLVFGYYNDGTLSNISIKKEQFSVVRSVNGQTGNATLNAGDIGYNDNATYSSGTVGNKLQNLGNSIDGIGDTILLMQEDLRQIDGDIDELDESLQYAKDDIEEIKDVISGPVDETPALINGKCITQQGGIYYIADVASNSWRVSERVAVHPGDKFIINAQMKYNYFIGAMNSEEVIVSGVPYTAGTLIGQECYELENYEYTVPSNIRYLVFGAYISPPTYNTFSVQKIEVGTVVRTINNKTGDVELTSGDIPHDNTEEYPDGTVGKNIKELWSLFDVKETNVTPAMAGFGLINESTGAITTYSDGGWKITGYMRVNQGDQYVINAWQKWNNAFFIACDENKDVVSIVPSSAAEMHTGNYYQMWNHAYEVPEDVCYLLFGYYENASPRQPDPICPPLLVKKIEYVPKNRDNVEDVISIATSDKIGFFGNSYLNGYPMRTHHSLDNLSMWSDYLFYNFAKSGDDILGTLNRINSNSVWLGNIPVQDWGIKYGILAMHANDGAMFSANPETFYQNAKKACEAIRAMGATPILGTEHQQSVRDYGFQHLASEEGYEFWDWAKEYAAANWFVPFMHRGHPATRTQWAWTYGMKDYIDALPRPMKSIKLFRKRPNISDNLDALKYDSVIERSKRFVEIYNGSNCLTKATEKYFDRLDDSHDKYEDVNSEYQKLQGHAGGVQFGKYALIECVTPYVHKDISSLKMYLDATNVANAYIRKTISFVDPLPDDRYIAFGIQSGGTSLTQGTSFTVTDGVFSDSILGTYIVDKVIGNIVITTTSSTGKTTSETDTPVIDISGVVLQGSYDYPSAEYMERYSDPLCEWDTIILGSNGETDLTDYTSTHMDYDKISILLVAESNTNIVLNEVYFNVEGTSKKNIIATKRVRTKKNGTPVIVDNLLDDDSAWDNINSVPKYTPVSYTIGGRTFTDPLPTGVSTVRVVQEGSYISQDLLTDDLGNDPYYVDKLQIRILARYFPTFVYNDTLWASSEIYEGSYDCAEMSICIENNVRCASAQVGASWHEYIFDVDYFNTSDIKKLRINCDSKSIQIAKVEAVVTNSNDWQIAYNNGGINIDR